MNPKYKPQIDPIQLEILRRLITIKSAKFSALQPTGMENDKYNYHLQFLVKKGLLEKENMLYKLSVDGKKLISNLNSKGDVFDLFKASVALYVVKDKYSKSPMILQQKRKRVPFFGDISSVAGKIKWGERAEDAAKRKLFEETGLIAEFKLFGVLRKTRVDEHGKVYEDTIYHSCFAEDPAGDLLEDTIYGCNFWQPFDMAVKSMENNIDGGEFGIKEVENVLKGDLNMHYYHQIFQVSEY